MAFTNDPTFIDGLTYSALEVRLVDALMVQANGSAGGSVSGIRPGDPGLAVSLVGSTITVTAGVASVFYPAFGLYRACSSSSTTLTLAAADPTNPRVDLVYLRVWDNAVDGAGLSKADTVYLAGTPAVSPVAPTPTAPVVYIPLATISVPKVGGGSASVSTAIRPVTVAPGGISPSATTAGTYAGQWRDDAGSSGQLWRYNGSAWESVLRLAGRVDVGSSGLTAPYSAAAGTAAGEYLKSQVTGDTIARFLATVDGGMAWGPGGSAARDTTLARTGVGQLTVGGNLIATNLTVATAYTPVLSGGALTIGNGTVNGRYVQSGGAYFVQVQIVCGSTSSLAASGSLIISMPATQAASAGAEGNAHFTKVSGGSNQAAGAPVVAGSNLLSILVGTGTTYNAFNTGSGAAVAAGSAIVASITIIP